MNQPVSSWIAGYEEVNNGAPRITQGMEYSVHACNSYAEANRPPESRGFEFIVVGQESRLFAGICAVQRAIKMNRRFATAVMGQQLQMECYLEAIQSEAVDYVANPLNQ